MSAPPASGPASFVTPSSAPHAESLALIVAPDAMLSKHLRRELESRACVVVSKSSVIDAIAELHGVEFDLMFVALELPPRSGVDLVRVARELSPDTEVIVLLSQEDVSSRDRMVDCVRHGAVDFLRLPLQGPELDSVLERSMRRRKVRTSTAIYEASHAILSNTNGKELPALIVSLASELLEADAVRFIRCTGDASSPSHAHVSSDIVDVGAGAKAPHVDAELLALVRHAVAKGYLSTGEPVLLPDDAHDVLDAQSHVRSAILCPLAIEGHLANVLVMERSSDPRPFRRGDAERAGVLASQLRLSLENVRLLEKTVATERLAAIGELAAGVAHEINSPLMYVVENCRQALEDAKALPGALGEDLCAALQDANEGAERIRAIASDLRMLARGTAALEDVDVNNAIRSALRIAGSALRSSVSVTTNLGELALVRGNPGRVCQVFVNLLVNAAQAASSSPNRVTVSIDTRREGDRVLVTVSDTGPGIPPEYLTRIFDSFFTTKASSGGTGLGLSITRAIVADHGGTISVESAIGKGTTFTIELPARRRDSHCKGARRQDAA